MKRKRYSLFIAAATAVVLIPVLTLRTTAPAKAEPVKGCVFRTLFGEEYSDTAYRYKTPQKVSSSITNGLDFLIKAQQTDGGWGAGLSSRQDILDPHAVATDPATTAMVCMALFRSGNTLTSGTYSKELKQGLEYLLKAVENADTASTTITTQVGTQIQVKLGANIDVILASQFLTNALDYTGQDDVLHQRITKCVERCVGKIQKAQTTNGSFSGSGWAGVLQSSLANNALESAQAKNISNLDTAVLRKSRDYQAGNVSTTSGAVATDMGAGVVLYSVSSSSRASAKEARMVREEIDKAKKEGKWKDGDAVNSTNLQKIGFNATDAARSATTYQVYSTANQKAQQSDVMSGFGSNGGEEFISYLQTGESMIIGKDMEWKKWYDNISGRMLSIQNSNGSWSGHHCITSPVFCTATSLLILSVDNDVDKLMAQGKSTMADAHR